MGKMKKFESKSEKDFYEIFNNEWEKLRKTPDTIFENIEYSPYIEKEYIKFKSSDSYLEYVSENNEYNKKKIIGKYFYENVIEPVINQFTGLLEESDISITGEVLLENTFEVISKKKDFFLTEADRTEIFFENLIEEGILKDIEFFLSLGTKDEIIESGILTEEQYNQLIEEGFFDMLAAGYNGAKTGWKAVKNNTAAIVNTAGAFWDIVLFGGFHPIRNKLRLSDIEDSHPEIVKVFKRYTFPENDNIKDFLRKYGNTDPKKLMEICWKQQTNYILSHAPGNRALVNETIKNINLAINEFFSDKVLYKRIQNNPFSIRSYLKNMRPEERAAIDRFRMCFYYKLIDYISSLAVSAFEIGQVQKSLIRRMEELPKADSTKSIFIYKDLYSLTKYNEADRIFAMAFGIMLELKMAIDAALEFIKKDPVYEIKLTSRDTLVKINNRIKQAIQEIQDTYRRIERAPKAKKYEENNRQNNEKELTGNKPLKPKKEDLFDI